MTMTQTPQYEHADLIWDETGTPCSTQFDDVYFSKVGGLDETRHVFLDHNQLSERFEQLSQQDDAQTFVIAETGFGTGLNFLAACQLWDHYLKDTPHRLVFISTEMYPLTPSDLEKAVQVWPELASWSEPLLKAYPKVCTGIQTLLIDSNIQLMLAFGDAARSFSKLNAQIDAWFLDGFAPSKNPDMWSTDLFQEIKRLSTPKTTFATFTAARVVKDLLTDHGFNFSKAKGFGRKRDMIHGEFIALDNNENACQNTEVWFQRPRPKHSVKNAIIIGAGLAGAHTAYNLAQRGWQVTVLEKKETAAKGASGNYQGVLYTKPSIQETKEDSFYLASFQYAIQHYTFHLSDKQSQSGHPLWHQVGLLQLAQTDKENIKTEKVEAKYLGTGFNRRLSAEEAKAQAGIDLNSAYPSLFYPDSGWVNPAETCSALLAHPNIHLICNEQVTDLRQLDKTWKVTTKNNQYDSEVVIIASAWEANQFEQTQHFPLTPIRGQVSQTVISDTSLPSPTTVICGDSYVTPVTDDQLNFGATFDLKVSETDYRNEDAERNINKLNEISDVFSPLKSTSLDRVTGRASVRCITNDRLPIIGLINDHQKMIEQYQELRKDRKWPYTEPGSYHQGLYANLSHGSKGLTSIPLCSELLCSMIEGDPLPLSQDLVDSLNPTRFTIKGLIQKKI